jgi:DNA polymerase III alpha subunit
MAKCSIFVLMRDSRPVTHTWAPPPAWPRPPAAVPAAHLSEPPNGARVTVAGLVLVRQRPGTAKGVIFVTLEDETGTVNVVVWAKVYERFRRAVIAGRLLRVTGRIQREGPVLHVVADEIEDISAMLDRLLEPDFRPPLCKAGDQPA